MISRLLVELLIPKQRRTFGLENTGDPRILVRNTLSHRKKSAFYSSSIGDGKIPNLPKW